MTSIKLRLIILSILLILLDKFYFMSSIRDTIVVYIQNNIQSIVHNIENYPKFVLLQIDKQQRLESENIQLKKQIEKYDLLLKQQNNLNINTKELQLIQKQINIYDGFKVYVARAIIDSNYLINNKLLIDKGISSEVVLGNAVINRNGIVGQVGMVNSKNAQVMLLTNPDFKIYAQTQNAKVKMLVQGIGNNKLIVKYIKKNVLIKQGDILVTTGLDDIYPANIPVAKIEKIFYENNGFNSALCDPIVNFNTLEYVLVMKNEN